MTLTTTGGQVYSAVMGHPEIVVSQLLLDADSLPVKVRELVFRRALRLALPTVLVANRSLPYPSDSCVSLMLVPSGEGQADRWILEQAGEQNLVITRDIPLACELAERGVRVINDRGTWYDIQTARERLSVRDFAYDLRQNGIDPGTQGRFGARELHAFAGIFEQALTRPF